MRRVWHFFFEYKGSSNLYCLCFLQNISLRFLALTNSRDVLSMPLWTLGSIASIMAILCGFIAEERADFVVVSVFLFVFTSNAFQVSYLNGWEEGSCQDGAVFEDLFCSRTRENKKSDRENSIKKPYLPPDVFSSYEHLPLVDPFYPLPHEVRTISDTLEYLGTCLLSRNPRGSSGRNLFSTQPILKEFCSGLPK